MSEIINKIGYNHEIGGCVITKEHTVADIVRWLISQGIADEVLYFIDAARRGDI